MVWGELVWANSGVNYGSGQASKCARQRDDSFEGRQAGRPAGA